MFITGVSGSFVGISSFLFQFYVFGLWVSQASGRHEIENNNLLTEGHSFC